MGAEFTFAGGGELVILIAGWATGPGGSQWVLLVWKESNSDPHALCGPSLRTGDAIPVPQLLSLGSPPPLFFFLV